MHELSLAEGILRVVEHAQARERFVRVKRLGLEVGALAGVEVAALRFALQALAPGTCLAQAEVEIHEPPGQAWCMACSASVVIRNRLEACPRCGGFQLTPTDGMDLRVRDLVVDDDDGR